MPNTYSVKQLVRTVKNRWRVERSYEDLKGQLGLDHYEGGSFIGWHHHVTVALACYAFLVAHRARSFSPSTSRACEHGSLPHANHDSARCFLVSAGVERQLVRLDLTVFRQWGTLRNDMMMFYGIASKRVSHREVA